MGLRGELLTEQQRNAVIRLIDAAEIVVHDYAAADLTTTRFAVELMAAEIRIIRAETATPSEESKTDERLRGHD
jgi:hypothetical protein